LPDLRLSTGGYLNAIVVQDDGKVIVGGFFSSVNGLARNNLARINVDGSVDTAWTPDPDGYVHALAVTSDAVFAGGAFGAIGGEFRNGLAKLSLLGNGSADPNWDPAAQSGSISVSVLTVGDPYLYVGGQFDSLGGLVGSSIARVELTGSGTADPLWLPIANDTVLAIVLDGSDVYVGGDFTEIGRWNRNYVARLDGSFGIADSTWNPSPNGSVSALTVSGTNIYVAGAFSFIGDESCTNLARVTKAGFGAADPLWTPTPDGRVSTLALSGQSLFAAGQFSQIGGQTRNGIAKLTAGGSGLADPAWDALIDDSVTTPVSILNVNGSDVYVGGSFHFAGSALALGLAKLDFQTGARIASFPTQIELPGSVKAIGFQGDGKIVVGGDFYLSGDLPRFNIARVNADGTLDTAWNPNVNGPVFALAISSSDIFVGGAFSTAGGVSRTNLAKFDALAPDAVDLAWDPNPEGGYAILSLSLGSDGLYVGGAFTRIGGEPRHNIAKISLSGAGDADLAWAPDTDPNPSGEIDQVTAVNDSVYVAGAFGNIGGQFRNTLAKLSAAAPGSADPTWSPIPPGPINAFAVEGDSLYAAAGNQMVRIATSGLGIVDPNWLSTSDGFIRCVAASGTNIYVGGNFSSIGGLSRRFMARLEANGGGLTDPSWDRPIGDDYAPVVALAAVEKGPYAGGNFTLIGGLSKVGFAYLPEVHAPVLTNSPPGLVILRNPADGPEVTHFQVTGISGLTLFASDGISTIQVGDFITAAQGAAGLTYSGTGNVTVVSALTNAPIGAGASPSIIFLPTGGSEPPAHLSQPRVLSDGSVAMTLEGASNRVYSILVSSDISQAVTQWAEALRLTNTTGVIEFTIQPPSSALQQYYRARRD
jgi:hypothetical protein